MAANKEFVERKVSEAVEMWLDMETSDLIKELRTLEEKELYLSQERSLNRALKKALKEILSDREDDELFNPYSEESFF